MTELPEIDPDAEEEEAGGDDEEHQVLYPEVEGEAK
jgi:hypothetical protein